MGNSESQYSIDGPKGTSFIFPRKQKPYSMKLGSTKDDVLSPHTWWKNTPLGSGYKAKCVGRGCLSPPKSRHSYSAQRCDYVCKGARGSTEHHWHRSPGCGIRRRQLSDDYEENPYGAELNGHSLNRHGNEQEVLEEQSSPRVVIKKDGTLRVEFTNTSGNPLLLDEASGPVQLLKFSPNLEATSTPSLPGSSGSRQEAHRGGPPPASTSSTARTSKGSSLSSEGSWYDSPWGPSAELCDQDQPCCTNRTLEHSPIHQLDSFAENPAPPSSSELYRDSTMAATFPTASELSSQSQQPPSGRRLHRASLASVLDVPLVEECAEPRQYSSFTLPCRRPKQRRHDFVFNKKDSIKNRIRRFSDWTGSLSRKKKKSQETRYKDASEAFDSGVDGLTADTSSPSQVSSLLWFPGASRAQSSGAIHQTTSDAVRQNIYENFMRELETETRTGGGDRRDPSTGTEEDGSSSESAEGSMEELDLLFEKEQGVVRRAGWLSFKPLVTLHKDRKLELVTRRKWKHYWVTLKGCTLLFYETYGKGSTEQELSPRYALLTEDSVVQAVPEHPKRENVFCLSNSFGDVYLFQASNQTDLENWVTAIHSASASLLAKRQGKEDTVRLLRNQVRTLLQKIDMDGKMKKMAELQLTVVSDPKNRKAIENQIQQWEQNLERFNMDLFRMRCYLASLQGGELPNPKSLLAIASRPTKSTLGRLGVFSVSSFHALICSRDEATARRRSLSVTCGQRKRSIFSSLKGLDNLTKRGRDKRPSVAQVLPRPLFPETHLRLHAGLRPGDEILVLNGQCVSVLDLALIQTLFSERTLHLRLRRDGPTPSARTSDCPAPLGKRSQEVRSKHHRAKSSSGALIFSHSSCMESLFGSLPEMLDFQRVFLQTLEERTASKPDFSTLETPSQFKKLLFSLGGSFLYYADHFKLYSGFCANHIKVQQVLKRAKTDQAFKQFLDARNPTKQHSSTLESYLIKPVQRVLKYPLLLRELVSLTNADSEEHYHLTEAVKAMEKVASHINEMQKIYEDFGSVFDQLVAEQTGLDKEVTEISMGEFLMHSSVVWLNPHPSLGRMRKDPEITVFVFKKAVILVYRENYKLKKKMTNPRSALCHGDSDPFKFRRLIPLSALQVRLGNAAGTESSCIWELIHSRSEVEGRPETVFQLCSSVPENKVNVIKVIRSILRENVRRNMRSEGTLEKKCKERLVPLLKTLPTSAKLGSSRASWLCKQPLEEVSFQAGNPKLGPDSDDGSLSSGTYSFSGVPPACTSSDSQASTAPQNWSQAQESDSQPRSTSVKESDILSDEDDDGFSEGGTRRDSGDSSSPASAIEAQFLHLKLSEEAVSKCVLAPCVQPEGIGDTPEIQHKPLRRHYNGVKGKTNSLKKNKEHMKNQNRSLDSQTGSVSPCGVVDLNTLLEREFSVQSLTSVVNEECFFDRAESCATDSGNTMST
uniref:TIAM Rac1 associated GEF 2 n=1 Tax=Xiphophorus couchianus TaxID=32473 RepID=A0A3B5MCW6_9TELE